MKETGNHEMQDKIRPKNSDGQAEAGGAEGINCFYFFTFYDMISII